MGTALRERHARGVSLTQAGHAFLARAQRVVEEVDDMERNLSSLAQTPSGEVRIALPQRTCGLLAPPVFARVREKLPLVEQQVLEGTPSNVHGWLMRGETDIAMTYNADLGSGFVVRPFLVEPLFLFASAQVPRSSLGERYQSIVRSPTWPSCQSFCRANPTLVRLLIDRLCAGHGIRPRLEFETDGPATIRGMVEQGMGVTVFSLSTSLSYAVEIGQLIAVPFSSPLVNWKMSLARTRRDSGALAIKRVLQIVEQELERLRAWPNARRLILDTSLSLA
jgi:LysR family nitrogen assimilation transcriptional regulator